MSTFKLTYFNAPGRAESIRVAFFLSDVPFEDHRLSFPEFMALKAEGTFPLGSLPVLEVDGVAYTQTAAMLRFVAKLGQSGLYPSDPMKAFLVDSALDTFNDTLSTALVPSFYEQDMGKKLELRADFAAGPMKRCFGYVEGLLARSGGPFVAGDTMSIADVVIGLQIAQIRAGGLDGITVEHLADYPRLNALADAYAADPRIVKYASK